MHWMLLLAIGLPMSLFLAAFVVGCFERLHVRMFAPSEPGDWTGYMSRMAAVAIELGYVYRADGHHTKYGGKLPAILFLGPDHSTLALICQGTIANLPTRKTILMSQLRSGECIITTDDPGTCELDPLTRRQILIRSSFGELAERHARALDSGGPFEPFPADAGWECVDRITRARVDRMVAAGAARYADDGRDVFRKTVRGAFRASLIHGILQSFRHIVRSSG
ncbi:MAG TPA: hypothetical protein VG269_27255 [Tepidisphaeraceae bacterium]|jgi:hypothetical protein|nr:hypothetical protein [Tepidisphaeraceae bacterium]